MTAVAVLGWVVAAILAGLLIRQRRSIPIPQPFDERITHTLMVDASGWPESLRVLRGSVPVTMTRAHGKERPASIYHRTGTGAIYQAKG